MAKRSVKSGEKAAPTPEFPVPLFALLAALCFHAADAAAGLLSVGPDRTAQSAVAAVAAGSLALTALAAFGVWRRVRWGYWLGGLLALGVLIFETTGAILPSLARVQMLNQELAPQGFLSIALTLGKAIAYAWFLLGVVAERRARRRQQ